MRIGVSLAVGVALAGGVAIAGGKRHLVGGSGSSHKGGHYVTDSAPTYTYTPETPAAPAMATCVKGCPCGKVCIPCSKECHVNEAEAGAAAGQYNEGYRGASSEPAALRGPGLSFPRACAVLVGEVEACMSAMPADQRATWAAFLARVRHYLEYRLAGDGSYSTEQLVSEECAKTADKIEVHPVMRACASPRPAVAPAPPSRGNASDLGF